jgi:hypothetical protein
MIWVKKPRKLNGADWGDGEFGWQGFVLTQPKHKEVYMAVMLHENFLFQMPHSQRDEDRVRRQVNNIFGRKVLLRDSKYDEFSYYIDHQSRIVLPRVPDNRPEINLGFFRDFCDYVVETPNVVIIGGNDNENLPQLVSGDTDDYYALIRRFEEGVKDVYAYHLDKPRKWRIVGKDWNDKKISIILQFP